MFWHQLVAHVTDFHAEAEVLELHAVEARMPEAQETAGTLLLLTQFGTRLPF